jgi:hypothetical protein
MTMRGNPLRHKYLTQKNRAKERGIEWCFTFESWLEWWGADIENRGKKSWNLQMQRIGDRGPYHPDNVRKGTPKRNSATSQKNRIHEKSLAAAEGIKERMKGIPCSPPHDARSDDEKELRDMFTVRVMHSWHRG